MASSLTYKTYNPKVNVFKDNTIHLKSVSFVDGISDDENIDLDEL